MLDTKDSDFSSSREV